MKSDDNAVERVRDDDGDQPDLDGLDPVNADAEPSEPSLDLELGSDDDLIDADLGELDAEFLADDDDSEELDELDQDDFNDDDEWELSLLQELGIVDLDAPDCVASGVDTELRITEMDVVDDEAAA